MFKYLSILIILAGANTCQSKKGNMEENTSSMIEKSAENNNNLLHDVWVLSSINQEIINKEDYSAGIPTLEVNLTNMEISGFSGCNNYFAKIDSLQTDSVDFGFIVSTKKYCTGVDESTFFGNLEKTNTYKIEKLQLFLYHGDKLLLSFKKVD